MPDKINIKYISGETVEDDISYPQYSTVSVDKRSVRRYYNSLHKTILLNGCARHFYDYMIEKMTADNIFYANKQSRIGFINLIANITDGSVSYSDVMIKKAIKTIADSNLIRKLRRGVYIVNPEYSSYKDGAARIKLLKIWYENKNIYKKIRIKKIKAKRIKNTNTDEYRL